MITYHSYKSQEENIFSIIIPTWNNLSYIKLCVESIRKNSTYKHQIILHINDGSDGTVEWAKASGLSYTYSPENVGICKACNAAFTLASADYILYMNDDMYACPDWDKNLFQAIEEYGKDDFYFSGTMIEHKVTTNTCVTKTAYFGDSPENFKEADLLQQYKSLERSDWQGGCWPPSVMHRKYWNLIGGFSIELSPGMYSDPDIAMKLWMAGCRNYRGIGNSLVYHFMSKSTQKVKKNNGRKQFVMKWGMTAGFFYKNYISLGHEYKGLAEDPENEPGFKKKFFLAKIKAKFKSL